MEMNRVLKLFVNSPIHAAALRHWLLPPVLDDLARRSPERLLEIGSGRGDSTRMLLERLPRTRLTATDYDPAQVALAERRVVSGRVEHRRADATALPFPAGSFDAVAEFNSFHHVKDWIAAVKECARVLRPGGAFAVVDEALAFWGPLFRAIDRPESIFTKDEFVIAAGQAGLALAADASSRRIIRCVFVKE